MSVPKKVIPFLAFFFCFIFNYSSNTNHPFKNNNKPKIKERRK